MFKTIIWATDGSSAAELALPYAKSLAESARARLIVVHVDEFSVGKSGGYSVFVDEPETQAAIKKRVEELKREGLRGVSPDVEGADGRRSTCDR